MGLALFRPISFQLVSYSSNQIKNLILFPYTWRCRSNPSLSCTKSLNPIGIPEKTCVSRSILIGILNERVGSTCSIDNTLLQTPSWKGVKITIEDTLLVGWEESNETNHLELGKWLLIAYLSMLIYGLNFIHPIAWMPLC